jgi:hypothetical protein
MRVAWFLGEVGLERATHVVPVERCELVEVGEVRCPEFVCSQSDTDVAGPRSHRKQTRQHGLPRGCGEASMPGNARVTVDLYTSGA